MRVILIGISGKRRHGKDTAAERVLALNHTSTAGGSLVGAQSERIAQRLLEQAASIFPQVPWLTGKWKEKDAEKRRQFLIDLGDAVRRVDPEYYVQVLAQAVLRDVRMYGEAEIHRGVVLIAVPDLRYYMEANFLWTLATIHGFEFHNLHIVRPGYPEDVSALGKHGTEQEMALGLADRDDTKLVVPPHRVWVIANEWTQEQFEQRVMQWLKRVIAEE